MSNSKDKDVTGNKTKKVGLISRRTWTEEDYAKNDSYEVGPFHRVEIPDNLERDEPSEGVADDDTDDVAAGIGKLVEEKYALLGIDPVLPTSYMIGLNYRIQEHRNVESNKTSVPASAKSLRDAEAEWDRERTMGILAILISEGPGSLTEEGYNFLSRELVPTDQRADEENFSDWVHAARLIMDEAGYRPEEPRGKVNWYAVTALENLAAQSAPFPNLAGPDMPAVNLQFFSDVGHSEQEFIVAFDPQSAAAGAFQHFDEVSRGYMPVELVRVGYWETSKQVGLYQITFMS